MTEGLETRGGMKLIPVGTPSGVNKGGVAYTPSVKYRFKFQVGEITAVGVGTRGGLNSIPVRASPPVSRARRKKEGLRIDIRLVHLQSDQSF